MRGIKGFFKELLPEEWILVFFSCSVLTIHAALLLQQKLANAQGFISLLTAFIVFILFIAFFGRSKNKHLVFIRSYVHIPYYGIIFTSFQNTVHILNPLDRDLQLLKADVSIFGTDLTVLAEKITSPLLTEILIICYFSYYLLPTLSSLVFYYYAHDENSLRRFRKFILTALIAWYSAFFFYLLYPAAGPDMAFPQNYTITLEGISPVTAWYFHTVTTYLREDAVRNTFPSLHFGIILIINFFAFRYGRRLYFWLCTLPLGTGLAIATIYLRQHYAVDLIGSVPLVAVSLWLAKKTVKN